jgi:D-alanine-D-alanine ligase
MVKPSRLGSSVGMTLAHAPGERAAALDTAFRHDTVAIVETYLAGARDLEVSIIGSEPPLGIYGPGEIVAGHEFYDFEAKYTPGLSETSTHAEIPDALRATIRKLARDPDQPLPDAAGGGRARLHRRLPAPHRAGARAARRAPRGDAQPRRPAAMRAAR